MLTTACTPAFQGFLRCSELTKGLARSCEHILGAPLKHFELRVPASKTDLFQRDATITIGASGGLCCPVTNLSQYLDATRRRLVNTPFFASSSGLPLTRPIFTQQIQRALLEAGVPDSRHYMSQSFRIGATRAAAEAGIHAWLTKTMGRWSSEAYLVYIRTPLATRLLVAERLFSGNGFPEPIVARVMRHVLESCPRRPAPAAESRKLDKLYAASEAGAHVSAFEEPHLQNNT